MNQPIYSQQSTLCYATSRTDRVVESLGVERGPQARIARRRSQRPRTQRNRAAIHYARAGF